MSERVFFSKALDPEDWGGKDYGCLTILLIPTKWWSLKEWKLALSLRAEMLKRLMMAYNLTSPTPPKQ